MKAGFARSKKSRRKAAAPQLSTLNLNSKLAITGATPIC